MVEVLAMAGMPAKCLKVSYQQSAHCYNDVTDVQLGMWVVHSKRQLLLNRRRVSF